MSFKARFWASRLDLKLEGVDGGEEGGEGKISPMCESIGHRPLRGRCPKRDKEKDEERKNRKKLSKLGVNPSRHIFISKSLPP